MSQPTTPSAPATDPRLASSQGGVSAKGRFHIGRAEFKRTGGPILVFAALVITFTLLNSNFLSMFNGMNIVRQSSVLLVLATGMTFVILMGSIDLSIGAVVNLSVVAGALLLQDHSRVWVLVIPLIGLACGMVNGLLFAFVGLPSFLVTLGTMFIFTGTALLLSGGRPITVRPEPIDALVTGQIGPFPAIAVWAVGVLIVAIVIASYTRFGRYVYAIGGGEKVARLSGVPVRRYKVLTFALTGLIAGIGGTLLMYRTQSATPAMGDPYLLTAIAAVVMGGTSLSGGVGGPHRTLLGVLVIAILANGMSVVNVQTFVQTLVEGVVVLVAVAITMDRSRIEVNK